MARTGSVRRSAFTSMTAGDTRIRGDGSPESGRAAPSVLAKPCDEARNAIVDGHARRVAERLAGTRNIGKGAQNITRLRRQSLDGRGASERLLEQRDQLRQRR